MNLLVTILLAVLIFGVIIIIHDLNLALRFCDRFLLLRGGSVYRYGDRSCMDAQALREHSHHPEKYYGQPHFMPSYTDGPTLLQLNRVRTLVRQTELACYRAFSDRDGAVTREDMILALNRLSSLCWILMIRCKANQL